jgi:hypothetical protein
MGPDEIEEWRQFGRLFFELHSEIAALSTNGDHRIVEGTGHKVPFHAPESVVRAFHDVALSATRLEQEGESREQ